MLLGYKFFATNIILMRKKPPVTMKFADIRLKKKFWAKLEKTEKNFVDRLNVLVRFIILGKNYAGLNWTWLESSNG